MKTSSLVIPAGRIEQRIFFLRETKIMLSSDLAELYGVAVKVLNQAVKRNRGRFPDDLEKRYDRQFKAVFVAFRQLMNAPPAKSKQIGFRPKVLKK